MSAQERIDELKGRLEGLTGPAIQIRSDARHLEESTSDDGRGRESNRPTKIPVPGWKDILWRTWGEVSEANLFLVAGGVTYAVLLALFPALAALVSIYGLVLNPRQVEAQVGALAGVLPEQSRELLSTELHALVSASTGALGFGAAIALLFALWSASRGMNGLITALNISYQEKEKRSFLKLNLIAVGLTVAMIIGGLLIIALVAVLPAAVKLIGLDSTTKWLLLVFEWPLLILVVLGGLATIYRYAPSRDTPKWRWVSPGAITAAFLWLFGSVSFTIYVANFNNYNKTYGALGGVIVLLTWLYLFSFVILFGAAINAQSERQTHADSTDGPDRPMGQRGAEAADTLGPSQK